MTISERYFALSIDKMKIRSGLVFRKYTGELAAFATLDKSMKILRDCWNPCALVVWMLHPSYVAEQVLQFMVRHILKPSVLFPVAMFPCTCLTGEKLSQWCMMSLKY